jgi:hypothetical protein
LDPTVTPTVSSTASPTLKPVSPTPNPTPNPTFSPTALTGCRIGNEQGGPKTSAATAFPIECGESLQNTCRADVSGNSNVDCNDECSNLFINECQVTCSGDRDVCYGVYFSDSDILCLNNSTCQSDYVYDSQMNCEGDASCYYTTLYSDYSGSLDCNGYVSCAYSSTTYFPNVDCAAVSSCEGGYITTPYVLDCRGSSSCYNANVYTAYTEVNCFGAFSCTGGTFEDGSPGFSITPYVSEETNIPVDLEVNCECRNSVDCGLYPDYIACGYELSSPVNTRRNTYIDVGPTGTLNCVGVQGCGRLTVNDCSRVSFNTPSDKVGVVDPNGNSC